MTSVEPGVLDANVRAYAINADAAQPGAARTLLEAACAPSTSLYVTSQIRCEFYSIITNVRRFPKAASAAEAVRILSTILALPGLQILPMPSQVVAGWIHLLGRHAVEGAGVFAVPDTFFPPQASRHQHFGRNCANCSSVGGGISGLSPAGKRTRENRR